MRFMLECLKDLDNSLKHHGGRLYVFFGDPVEVFQNLFKVIHFKVFPSTNCPYRVVKVTCFEKKSVQVLTREFLHLPLNLCKIMHIMPM